MNPKTQAKGKKHCPGCTRIKPLSGFNKNRGRRSGVGSYCRQCVKMRYQHDKKNSKYQAQRKRYRTSIREKQREYHKKYAKRNRDRLRRYHSVYAVTYWKKRAKADPDFKLLHYLRNALRQNLARYSGKRSGRTIQLLGCTIADFRIYLESRFEPGMSWQNYGSVWEIDHVVPCVLFDLSKPEHQRRCFHFSNLQPLTVSQNRSKGRRLFVGPEMLPL